jgi:protein-disulfide isomerase
MGAMGHIEFWKATVVVLTGSLALSSGAAGTPAQAPVAPPDRPPLAEVNGKPIAADDVEKALGNELRKLEEQIYNLKRQRLDAMISERVLADEAATRGTTVAKLLDAEVTSKVGLVSETDLEAYCDKHKAECAATEDQDADSKRATVRNRLQNQRLAGRRAEYIQTLRAAADVKVFLKAPPVFRAAITEGTLPVRGEKGSPITLVEFSDFHCPFCKRVEPTIKQVLEKYGTQVRFVYRDFPIDSMHPQARKASEAARCANDQGEYWEFHELLYQGGPDASPATMSALAKKTGLDVAKFDACVAAGTHKAAVQADIDEGRKLGVTGTPAFFINGRLVSGAQPFEHFARIIDDELARARDAAQSGQRPPQD